MLTDKKILGKMQQIEQRYAALRFETVATVPVAYCQTREYLRREPENAEWQPAEPGLTWGGSWVTAWFRGDVTLPEQCAGRRVFVRARTGGETLFFVNGEARGVFDGNHPMVMMTGSGEAGRSYHLALEAYAGHNFPGTQPNDAPHVVADNSCRFEGVDVVLEREDVSGFVFDLKALNQLAKVLDENSLRRGRIIAALGRAYAVLDAMPAETEEESWRPKMHEAREILRPLLELKNGPTMPSFGLTGHSHIDTAWLWPLAETWRKCARTFSSVLNLMEQYPEFRFLQSSPCQTDVVRREYPEIYQRIQKMVAAGRWEPNGGMWVEPDCNIPSGESFVRQLLVGQQTTREMFGYTSDTLWLPDVFGYSAALPQILRGCGVEFFCTTKLSWNDTNRFPYDTFVWRGIDGTPVISHFNTIHCWPDPETLTGQWNWVQHKDVQDRRYTAYGFGDGGGGPMAEMVEMARRVEDLEGCPRARHQSVSEFMRGVRDELTDLPEWWGELYLELHRGTLTSIAGVKRGNRKTEIALREAEFLATQAARRNVPYPKERLQELWKTLLTNQFHDILPGSSIAEVNDEAIESFARCIAGAEAVSREAFSALARRAQGADAGILVSNSLSWDRSGELVLPGVPAGMRPAGEGVRAQEFTDLEGEQKLAVSGLTLPALSITPQALVANPPVDDASPFVVAEDRVETPHTVVRFDAAGRIVSLLDRASGRELAAPGGALNTFLFGEDIPQAWDNWDIDSDQRLKLAPAGELIQRTVTANGLLQLRIRSEYRLSPHSSLTQEMVFHADTPRIDFETVVDWHEKHRLLKAAFPLNLLVDSARHEIQYGHVERPTHRNLPQDRARFEVCAHKWSDLSENGFGVALLNDCKYGVDVRGSEIRLSLLKSGVHPDARGDAGKHRVTYALLPHTGGFSVPAVVRPAYELNIPLTTALADAVTAGGTSLLTLDAPNVIVESVKAAEQGNGIVVRLYEAGKSGVTARLQLNQAYQSVQETNLLEEEARALAVVDGAVRLTFRPFEIKTLLLIP